MVITLLVQLDLKARASEKRRGVGEVMSVELCYQLPYPPSVNHIYRRTKRGGVMLDDKARAYRDEVIYVIGKGHTAINGPIRVRIDAYMPDKRKRDLDNLCKSLFDAMTHAGVWKDDSQIDFLIINRAGFESPGRVLVTVGNIAN